jgi:formylglycine-generating enzyme required for sulfatase activity
MIVGRSSSELDDPRLMLAESGGRRLLAKTGTFSECANAYGVYDMVGNQDEVVSDTVGDHMVFVGSFYSRAQSKPLGCASAISAHHASLYTDYSIGLRCCKDR